MGDPQFLPGELDLSFGTTLEMSQAPLSSDNFWNTAAQGNILATEPTRFRKYGLYKRFESGVSPPEDYHGDTTEAKCNKSDVTTELTGLDSSPWSPNHEDDLSHLTINATNAITARNIKPSRNVDDFKERDYFTEPQSTACYLPEALNDDAVHTASELPVVPISGNMMMAVPNCSGAKADAERSRKRHRVRRPLNGVPEDGYLWHKYGQKRLMGTNLMRFYYRCGLLKERGCVAKRTIDFEKDRSEALKISYAGEHCHAFRNRISGSSNGNHASALSWRPIMPLISKPSVGTFHSTISTTASSSLSGFSSSNCGALTSFTPSLSLTQAPMNFSGSVFDTAPTEVFSGTHLSPNFPPPGAASVDFCSGGSPLEEVRGLAVQESNFDAQIFSPTQQGFYQDSMCTSLGSARLPVCASDDLDIIELVTRLKQNGVL